jgi:hypothetical protein
MAREMLDFFLPTLKIGYITGQISKSSSPAVEVSSLALEPEFQLSFPALLVFFVTNRFRILRRTHSWNEIS